MFNSSLSRISLKTTLRSPYTNSSKITGRTSTTSTLRNAQPCSSLRTSIMSSCIQTTKTSSMNMNKRMMTSGNDKTSGSFLTRWMSPREMPDRGTGKWYAEMVLICSVFAVTGTSTMVIVSIHIVRHLSTKLYHLLFLILIPSHTHTYINLIRLS